MTDFEDMITTAQAVALAEELGKSYVQEYIAESARKGNIKGARKMWDNAKAPWVFPKDAFIEWATQARRPGPKSD